MEHSVLVLAWEYNNNNKKLKTLVVSKRQLSKHQADDISRTKLIGLRREQRKSCLPKQTLVDKILPCRRIKLPIYKTLILDGVKTGVLLSNLAQQFCRKNADDPENFFLYLTLLVYLKLWFWIRMPKLKREEAGSLPKSEGQKLQKMHTQGGADFGSVRNIVKFSNLPVSKVRQLLHSKPS